MGVVEAGATSGARRWTASASLFCCRCIDSMHCTRVSKFASQPAPPTLRTGAVLSVALLRACSPWLVDRVRSVILHRFHVGWLGLVLWNDSSTGRNSTYNYGYVCAFCYYLLCAHCVGFVLRSGAASAWRRRLYLAALIY